MSYNQYVIALHSTDHGQFNHSGDPIRKAAPFSHTRSQDFLWGCTFLLPKKLTAFFSPLPRYVSATNLWFLNVRSNIKTAW